MHVQNHDTFYKHRRNSNGTFFFINETYTQLISLNYYIRYICLNLIQIEYVTYKACKLYIFFHQREHTLWKSH